MQSPRPLLPHQETRPQIHPARREHNTLRRALNVPFVPGRGAGGDGHLPSANKLESRSAGAVWDADAADEAEQPKLSWAGKRRCGMAVEGSWERAGRGVCRGLGRREEGPRKQKSNRSRSRRWGLLLTKFGKEYTGGAILTTPSTGLSTYPRGDRAVTRPSKKSASRHHHSSTTSIWLLMKPAIVVQISCKGT